MKKLIAIASIFLAVSLSAQTAQVKQKAKTTAEQQVQNFDKEVNLSDKQKKEMKTLYEQKNAKSINDKEFDGKMQKVLTKDQYNKYKTKKNATATAATSKKATAAKKKIVQQKTR